MAERLVSEALKPLDGTFDTGAMARGEPGLPLRFRWRKREYAVVEVLDSWKETKESLDCPGCMYLKKHWYRVLTDDGTQMRLYFDRQPRRGARPTARWWVYSVIAEG